MDVESPCPTYKLKIDGNTAGGSKEKARENGF